MDKIYKFDLALIIISLGVLMVLVGFARPLVIAPIDDYKTSSTEILFEIDKAEKILIDDNIDFTTPEEYNFKEGEKIELDPGKYYWKAVGVLGSEVRTLTINSVVSLELREIEEGIYGVVNAGNLRLNVDVYDGENLVDKLKLDINEEKESSGTKFVGGQDED